MSDVNNDSKSSWVQIEPLKEVCIDGEDVKNIIDFFRHFDIQMSDAFKDALKAFEDANVRNAPEEELIKRQNDLRIQLALAIAHQNADSFKNEIFNEVVETCKQVIFVNNFEDQLNEIVKE